MAEHEDAVIRNYSLRYLDSVNTNIQLSFIKIFPLFIMAYEHYVEALVWCGVPIVTRKL